MSKQFRINLIVILALLPALSMAHDVTAADQEILNRDGLLGYIRVGATHMLTGYDHLLFLAGVIFYLSGLKDILKFITVFTLGHCFTLISASYLGITANEYLVDAVIALSVLYKGFENLGGFKKINIKPPHLLYMVFLFGLIHGFGLATRLQTFETGMDQFLAKILCFNLGVEIGQVLALVPFVILITWWKKHKSYAAFYKAANTYIVIAGVGLFVYQMWQYFNV